MKIENMPLDRVINGVLRSLFEIEYKILKFKIPISMRVKW